MSDDAIVGDWNHRQQWNERGVLYQVATLDAGGFAVMRFEKTDVGYAIVASAPIASAQEAVEQARRLTRRAMQ